MEKSNIKYTSDGKKVVVIGSLNSKEKIVQEIFIVEGSEIPSGEHFVVKSLHDSVAISWKEKSLKEIEDRYNKTYESKLREVDVIEKSFNLKVAIVKEKLSFLNKLQNNLSEESFSQLISFISGDIKYVVKDHYSDLSIDEYDESIHTKEYGRFESIRLLSVYGKTDGSICYRMNQYSDGSGSSNYNIYPYSNFEDAKKQLVILFFDQLKKRGLSQGLIKVSEKYQIEIPKEEIDSYKEKCRKNIIDNIESRKKDIEKYQEELKNI